MFKMKLLIKLFLIILLFAPAACYKNITVKYWTTFKFKDILFIYEQKDCYLTDNSEKLGFQYQSWKCREISIDIRSAPK